MTFHHEETFLTRSPRHTRNSFLLTHGLSVGRFGSHCNRSVAMETWFGILMGDWHHDECNKLYQKDQSLIHATKNLP